MIDQRRDHAARTAPRRPKINQHGDVGFQHLALKRLVRHHRGERACEWIRDARRGWPCQSRRRRGCVRGRDRAMTRDDTRASRVITRASRLSRHHPRRGIHSFIRAPDPTLGARDRIRRRIASPSARPPSRARENTATHARVNFYSTRARDRRLARVVASPPVRAFAHARRGPIPRGSTHPARIRIPARAMGRRRIVTVTHRSCSSPPRASRSPRAICVGGAFAAPRARGASRSSSSSPRASSRARPSSSAGARRDAGAGEAVEGGVRAVEGLVRGSCLVDRVVEGLVRGS